MVENSQKNVYGWRGNNFDTNMKDVSSYLYVRAQKSAFEFISSNLNGPSIWTVKSYIDSHKKLHHEGVILFDEFVDFLKNNKFPMEVILSEDYTILQKSCQKWNTADQKIL